MRNQMQNERRGAAVAWLLTKPDARVFIRRAETAHDKYSTHRGKQVGKK